MGLRFPARAVITAVTEHLDASAPNDDETLCASPAQDAHTEMSTSRILLAGLGSCWRDASSSKRGRERITAARLGDMTGGSGASVFELLIIGAVAAPTLLVPLVAVYWAFKTGRRSGRAAPRNH